MVKLIALYKKPDDIQAFEQHYFDVHIPLVNKVPGLIKCEVTKITGAPIGEAKFYLMAEMYYESMDALNAANASPEGKAVARDVMGFALNLITLFFGEVNE